MECIMKRVPLVTLGAFAALAAISCSDTRTVLAPDSARFSADASHTWQAGNGSAWHGYHAPTVTYDAARTPFELCAQWSDLALFGRDNGRYADTDFFSFDFYQLTEGEDDWQRIGSANSRDREEAACYIVGALDEGTYSFRVTGMARHGSGRATTTHHTTAWQENITIGDVEQITFSVTIDPSLSEIEIDGSVQLAATIKDRDENEVENPTLFWTSDNEIAAAVDGSGLVTATGNGYGNIKITATYSYGGADYSGNATVTVRRPPPSVEISAPGDGAEFTEGSPISFTGSATDADGVLLTAGDLAWTSSADGGFGTGESFNYAGLSIGSHMITLTATDAQGSEAAATVTITVRATSGGAPPILTETITAGNTHSCGLDESGNAHCWGNNSNGRLGDGTTTNRPTPVAVQMPLGVSFVSISGGGSHTVALSTTGAAYAWGNNGNGRVGDGTTTNRPTPVAVQMPEGVSFASIDAGGFFTVALSTTGAAYAWGENGYYGQLGDGTMADRLMPVAVQMPEGASFAAIKGGQFHSVALSTTGAAYAWGSNGSGQLGDGTYTERHSPVTVVGGITFWTQ
jgi:hypothetical protein